MDPDTCLTEIRSLVQRVDDTDESDTVEDRFERLVQATGPAGRRPRHVDEYGRLPACRLAARSPRSHAASEERVDVGEQHVQGGRC